MIKLQPSIRQSAVSKHKSQTICLNTQTHYQSPEWDARVKSENAALCLRWSEGGIWKLQRGCQAVFESIWKASCCIWKSPQGRASLHSQKSPWTQVTKTGTTPCCYSFINVEYNVVNHHRSHLQGLIFVFHNATQSWEGFGVIIVIATPS